MSATIEKPKFQLACQGCQWKQNEPRDYFVARAIAWAHQQKVAYGREKHAVEFVPARGTK